MKKTTRNVMIGAGTFMAGAAAVGAVSNTVTRFLMKVALDRELPKVRNMHKAKAQLCGFADADMLSNALGEAAEILENSGCETVEISGYDGEKLIGHWYHCENAERIIIAMHGWRSSWARDFGIISEFWHENRCSVLYAEQRGQNNSGGECMGFGMIERYDCLEWAKWVNENTEEKPIYLAGVSMGAATVMMASELDMPERVCGIVADCGFTSPDAIWKHVVEQNLHLPYGIRKATVDSICRKKLRMGARECSSATALQKSRIPVLFIHGTEDHFVPVEMTYENYKACVAPKRLFIVPGADHGMSYMTDREGYQRALQDFWNEFN